MTNRRNKFEIIRKEMSENISLVNPFSFHPQSFNELMNYRPLHLSQRHSESFILRLKRALASRACLKKNRVAALFFFETVRRKCGLSLTNKPNITSFDFPKTCALAPTILAKGDVCLWFLVNIHGISLHLPTVYTPQ